MRLEQRSRRKKVDSTPANHVRHDNKQELSVEALMELPFLILRGQTPQSCLPMYVEWQIWVMMARCPLCLL